MIMWMWCENNIKDILPTNTEKENKYFIALFLRMKGLVQREKHLDKLHEQSGRVTSELRECLLRKFIFDKAWAWKIYAHEQTLYSDSANKNSTEAAI